MFEDLSVCMLEEALVTGRRGLSIATLIFCLPALNVGAQCWTLGGPGEGAFAQPDRDSRMARLAAACSTRLGALERTALARFFWCSMSRSGACR
jgi:hypothetical protein